MASSCGCMFVRLPAVFFFFFRHHNLIILIQCHKNITTIWFCLKMVDTGIPPKKTLNSNKHMKQYDCPMDLRAPYFSDKLIFQLGVRRGSLSVWQRCFRLQQTHGVVMLP